MPMGTERNKLKYKADRHCKKLVTGFEARIAELLPK